VTGPGSPAASSALQTAPSQLERTLGRLVDAGIGQPAELAALLGLEPQHIGRPLRTLARNGVLEFSPAGDLQLTLVGRTWLGLPTELVIPKPIEAIAIDALSPVEATTAPEQPRTVPARQRVALHGLAPGVVEAHAFATDREEHAIGSPLSVEPAHEDEQRPGVLAGRRVAFRTAEVTRRDADSQPVPVAVPTPRPKRLKFGWPRLGVAWPTPTTSGLGRLGLGITWPTGRMRSGLGWLGRWIAWRMPGLGMPGPGMPGLGRLGLGIGWPKWPAVAVPRLRQLVVAVPATVLVLGVSVGLPAWAVATVAPGRGAVAAHDAPDAHDEGRSAPAAGPAVPPDGPVGSAPGRSVPPPGTLGSPSGSADSPAAPATGPGDPRVQWVVVNHTNGLGLVLRPSPASAARVLTLQEGARVRVTGEPVQQGGRAWLPVTSATGKSGWVAGDFVAPAP
jgi:hypothetical protein